MDADVAGNLIKVRSPLLACAAAPGAAGCAEIFQGLKNPYYIGDHVALTQTTGRVDAWITAPGAYAVAAHRAAYVVAAVNFARTNNLRLVVKGGGCATAGVAGLVQAGGGFPSLRCDPTKSLLKMEVRAGIEPTYADLQSAA